MDCRQFRERHAPFVDLMCSAVDEHEMREHLRTCADCARLDTRIRRSLMLVRNLPTIEPSSDFRARLDARLREAALTTERFAPAPMRLSYGVFAAVAAGIALVTYLGSDLVRRSSPADLRMAPVVAMLPQSETSQTAAPAMVAAVPTGMSVWPAIVYASQAQMHFVAAELATER